MTLLVARLYLSGNRWRSIVSAPLIFSARRKRRILLLSWRVWYFWGHYELSKTESMSWSAILITFASTMWSIAFTTPRFMVLLHWIPSCREVLAFNRFPYAHSTWFSVSFPSVILIWRCFQSGCSKLSWCVRGEKWATGWFYVINSIARACTKKLNSLWWWRGTFIFVDTFLYLLSWRGFSRWWGCWLWVL